MVEKVKLLNTKMRVFIECDVSEASWALGYGSMTKDVRKRVEVTNQLEGKDQTSALYISDMINYIGMRELESRGVRIMEGPASLPDGVSMTLFWQDGQGPMSAKVVMRHPSAPQDVIAYGQDYTAAIRSASTEMSRLLKV